MAAKTEPTITENPISAAVSAEKKAPEVKNAQPAATEQTTGSSATETQDIADKSKKKRKVSEKTFLSSLGTTAGKAGRVAVGELYRDTKKTLKDGVKKMEEAGKKAADKLVQETEQGR